ncbi:MAG: hypothetical protein ACFCU6_09300 [Balneolaceae bacterium]
METDLTSILIGLAALATFFVPIGLHELSQKQKISKARKSLLALAEKIGIHLNEIEVLRNGTAIGIDSQNKHLLYLKKGTEIILNINKVNSCKPYKNQKNELSEDGNSRTVQEMGIHISFLNGQSHKEEEKLIFFEGIEGNVAGDESIIIQRWINKINKI